MFPSSFFCLLTWLKNLSCVSFYYRPFPCWLRHDYQKQHWSRNCLQPKKSITLETRCHMKDIQKRIPGFQVHPRKFSFIKNYREKLQYHECQLYYAGIFKALDLLYADFGSKFRGLNLPKFGWLSGPKSSNLVVTIQQKWDL